MCLFMPELHWRLLSNRFLERSLRDIMDANTQRSIIICLIYNKSSTVKELYLTYKHKTFILLLHVCAYNYFIQTLAQFSFVAIIFNVPTARHCICLIDLLFTFMSCLHTKIVQAQHGDYLGLVRNNLWKPQFVGKIYTQIGVLSQNILLTYIYSFLFIQLDLSPKKFNLNLCLLIY